MILVINLNASVDKRYELGKLVPGEVMRARSVQNTPGGKGLHVANVATILGENVVVSGFLGGKSGEFIAEETANYGIKGDFVTVAGETRSCLAIIDDAGQQTEILEPGPEISSEELHAFKVKFIQLMAKADVIVASGSAPRGIAKDIYAKLIKTAQEPGKKFLLDTSGELLAQGIAAQPFFIKPNQDEIKALTGREMKDEADIVREIKGFLAQGIKVAAVSLGAAGSLVGIASEAFTPEAGGIYRVTVPHIECVNPVGSGDSYVGGMAVALERGLSAEDALRLAAACGTANAMEAESGFVRQAMVDELVPQIKVEKL